MSEGIMEKEPLLPRRTSEKERSSFWEGKDGALGWTVATAIMLINFITIGLGRMSGILYVDFMREYKVNRKLASAPFSVQQSTRNLFGPLVGVLGQRFGIRSVTIVGGLLGAGSAAACAFAKDITWITVFWGGFYGTGIAFTSTLSQVILDEYFENNLSSASGLSFSGGSVGAMVFSFVLQRTIDEFGLENSYFIMGAIILLVVPLALILTSPPWTKKENTSNEKRSLNNQTNLAFNKQLRKSLANGDMFSIEKETGINKNYDITQSLNVDPSSLPAESFKGLSQSQFERSGRFDKKDGSQLDLIYGTFEEDDAAFGTGKNTDRTTSSYGPKINGRVGIEEENIAELCQDDQEGVDHGVVNGFSDSNKTVSGNGLSSYKVELEKEKARCNGINKHGSLHANGLNNSIKLDKEVSELSRKLSPSNGFNHKLLYLRPTFNDDFSHLSFPREDTDIILNFCETDSVNTHSDKLNRIKQSKVDDVLEKLTNGDIRSSNSDYKVGNGISRNNAADKVIKNGINFHNQENQSEFPKKLEHSAKNTPTTSANSSPNSVSKVDRLLYLNQNPDIKFLRKNTNHVVKILMLNANFFSEQLFRKQLEILYNLAEKEEIRNSFEKYVLENKTKKVEIDKFLKDHEKEGLDLDNKIVEDIFKTEQFNIFLDHLYCVFQKDESNLLLNFEEKQKTQKIIAELKKLYKFAYTYKTKHKRREPESSASSGEEMISTEKNTKHKTTRHNKKGLRRQKSTSLDRESPLTRQSSWGQQSLPSKLPSNEQWRLPIDDAPTDGCCSIPRQIRTVLKLYLNPAFLVICLCRAVHLLTFMGVLTVIVDYSMDRGLRESDGKYAVTAMSLGDLIGRLCSGWVTDCMFVGLERFMLIAMLLIGVVSISFPLVPPSTVLLLACVYSILQGSVFIRHPILVSKYTRTEERTVGMGFMTLFSGLLGFLMPMYIGHFRDGIGSYNQVFYINGAVCAGIGFLWIFEPWLKKFAR